MEKLVYEFKPLVCLIFASMGFVHGDGSQIAKVSAVALLLAATLIIYGRLKHRKMI